MFLYCKKAHIFRNEKGIAMTYSKEDLKVVLRPSKILLETCSARSKILAVKLARSLEAPLGLNYRGWRSSSSMLETRSARSKILAFKTRSLAR